ncbi:hypothetical protein ACHQM5_016756 [Ranunculus cassubicifolius]
MVDHQTSSFRNKAAHFVSDLTTVILNPISDQLSNSSEDTMEVETSHLESITQEDPILYGPDTSSFTAFLYSLLSSPESRMCPNVEDQNEFQIDKNELASEQGAEEKSGRTSGFSGEKQSLGTNRYRSQASEKKVDGSSHHGLEEVSLVRLPDISEPSLLLSEKARRSLYTSLPVVAQGRKWMLLYSTWRHGISLSTLYRRSLLSPGFSLLVVGDRQGSVFGGLVESPLRPTNKRKYQGSHNTFVFTTTSGEPVVFRPTGVNRYFALCSTEFLALGGGGHFALYLDGDLLSGSSSVSETYGNTCLAHSEEFQVKEVELWSFNPPRYADTVSLWGTELPEIYR